MDALVLGLCFVALIAMVVIPPNFPDAEIKYQTEKEKLNERWDARNVPTTNENIGNTTTIEI
jgi:hypothetical protein